jgi:hypothetical protein
MLKQFFHCSIYICLGCNKLSDLLALIYYVGGLWLTLHNHITVAEIKTIFEVLASGLTQRIGSQDSCDNCL